MYLVLGSNDYTARVMDAPGRFKRAAEVTKTTVSREVARQWIADGFTVVAAIVDGSHAYPTRYNRIEPAKLGPRGGLEGVAWGIAA